MVKRKKPKDEYTSKEQNQPEQNAESSKPDEPEETLIFEAPQIWQQQLAKLSPEKRKKLHDDILKAGQKYMAEGQSKNNTKDNS